MADMWRQGVFVFRCAPAESALIAQAIDAGHRLCADTDPAPPGAELLAAFPPTDATDPWSGFREAFVDPDFPVVGTDFASEPDPGDPSACIASFSSMDDFDPSGIAVLLQRCCHETLAGGPIGFEWAETCSKLREGEFGGGWCAVFADRIELESTGTALSRALEGGIV